MVIQENILLKHYSNYQIGGPARYFCEAASVDNVLQAAEFAKSKNLPIFILGGGTNLLLPDTGFNGLVIKISLTTLQEEGDRVFVGAGVMVSSVLQFAIKKDLSGLEWAGGLPGTFGGAVRGNAGAFGGETKDIILEVESLNMQSGTRMQRTKAECEFAYRSSIFKTKAIDEVILGAWIRLTPGDQKSILGAIEEKITYRLTHHPMEYPNIGSIFKNVPVEKIPEPALKEFSAVIKKDPFPVVPTAYLIAEAGLKGVGTGGAMVSPKHPNFIINTHNATSADVEALIAQVKDAVRKKFSVNLEEEVIIVK